MISSTSFQKGSAHPNARWTPEEAIDVYQQAYWYGKPIRAIAMAKRSSTADIVNILNGSHWTVRDGLVPAYEEWKSANPPSSDIDLSSRWEAESAKRGPEALLTHDLMDFIFTAYTSGQGSYAIARTVVPDGVGEALVIRALKGQLVRQQLGELPMPTEAVSTIWAQRGKAPDPAVASQVRVTPEQINEIARLRTEKLEIRDIMSRTGLSYGIVKAACAGEHMLQRLGRADIPVRLKPPIRLQPEDLNQEDWRPLPRAPHILISKDGGIWSAKNNRVYRGKTNKNTGYRFVTMRRFGTEYVHTLVAEAWLGPRPPGMVVDHIDEDNTNNHYTNLQYITQSENIIKAKRLRGLSPTKKPQWVRGPNKQKVQHPNEAIESLPDEAWAEYSPGCGYWVSTMGRVFSAQSGKIHNPHRDSGGYLKVQMRIDDTFINRSVHALVAHLFLGPKPPGLVIIHLDEGTDPRLSNLKYGTRRENALRSVYFRRTGSLLPADFDGSYDPLKS